MEETKASALLKKAILRPQDAMTVADAATRSGLSLYETQRGLYALVSEFRGELTPTEKGELLFRFPTGFSKPWETGEAFDRIWKSVKKSALGLAKFVVRAWISIVMVAYVLIFAAILIALSFANRSDRDDRGGNSFGNMLMVDMLFRMIMDSLFWTFHPFSPFRVQTRRPKEPFYERVNRFFFGPEEVQEDPLEIKKRVLEEIRAQKGRIGVLDVLRVTGMTRQQADPFLAALMLEYNGDVKVSEFGGITYSFPELRKTTDSTTYRSHKTPSWFRQKVLAPLTGNEAGTNVMIAGLNAFNWFMSMVAIENKWTLEGLRYLLSGMPPQMIPDTGAPLLLGWIPFWFSTVLFALPLIRLLMRPTKQKELNRDNGRRGMLWAILNRLTPHGIQEVVLKQAWQEAAGEAPDERQISRQVIELGGELDLNTETGQTKYRFRNLEAEVQALEKERAQASAAEREVGAQISV